MARLEAKIKALLFAGEVDDVPALNRRVDLVVDFDLAKLGQDR